MFRWKDRRRRFHVLINPWRFFLALNARGGDFRPSFNDQRLFSSWHEPQSRDKTECRLVCATNLLYSLHEAQWASFWRWDITARFVFLRFLCRYTIRSIRRRLTLRCVEFLQAMTPLSTLYFFDGITIRSSYLCPGPMGAWRALETLKTLQLLI